MKWWIGPAVALALLPGTAQSAGAPDVAGTGNDFLAACEHPTTATLDLCYTYVRGMHEATLFWTDYFGKEPPFCMPKTATYMQGVDVMVKYLKGHPETRHQPMIGLYVQAFTATFPCPQTHALPPVDRKF